jgi:hypothetical protein
MEMWLRFVVRVSAYIGMIKVFCLAVLKVFAIRYFHLLRTLGVAKYEIFREVPDVSLEEERQRGRILKYCSYASFPHLADLPRLSISWRSDHTAKSINHLNLPHLQQQYYLLL